MIFGKRINNENKEKIMNFNIPLFNYRTIIVW